MTSQVMWIDVDNAPKCDQFVLCKNYNQRLFLNIRFAMVRKWAGTELRQAGKNILARAKQSAQINQLRIEISAQWAWVVASITSIKYLIFLALFADIFPQISWISEPAYVLWKTLQNAELKRRRTQGKWAQSGKVQNITPVKIIKHEFQ